MNTERITRTEGFTLIELIIVIAVFGIVAAVALPSVANVLPNYRLRSAARQLFSQMQKARSEAVKQNTNVGIAFTTVGYPTTGGGYTIFLDDGTGGGAGATAGDGIYTAGEPVLYTVQMPSDCTLYQTSFSNNTTGYNYKGLLLSGNTGSVEMRNNKSMWYQVSLSSITGHPKIKNSSDGNF